MIGVSDAIRKIQRGKERTMDAAVWSAFSPFIIAFAHGALGFWVAMRIEVNKTIAELRSDRREARAESEANSNIREVGGKPYVMNVRVSDAEIRQAERRGAIRILILRSHYSPPRQQRADSQQRRAHD